MNNSTTMNQHQEWVHPFDANPPIACNFPINSTTPFYMYIYCGVYLLGCLAVIIAGAYFYIRSLIRKHMKENSSVDNRISELASYGYKPNKQNIIEHV